MSHQTQLDKMCPRAGKAKIGTWLQAVRTWIVDMAARQSENKALLDELHDDHATSKTALDEMETLIEELYDDHATFKTAVDETKTLVDELYDDHATFKSAGDSLKTALKNMCLSDVGSGIGTIKINARSTATATYIVNGEFKSKVSTDNLWALTGFNCTNGKYSKCLLCLDDNTNSQIASGTEGDTAAGVVLPNIPADWSVVAMVQVHPTGTGDFTGGATDLDDATVVPNATFTDLAFHPDTFGTTPDSLSASKPSAGPETLSSGKPSSGSASLSASKPTALSAPTPDTLAS